MISTRLSNTMITTYLSKMRHLSCCILLRRSGTVMQKLFPVPTLYCVIATAIRLTVTLTLPLMSGLIPTCEKSSRMSFMVTGLCTIMTRNLHLGLRSLILTSICDDTLTISLSLVNQCSSNSMSQVVKRLLPGSTLTDKSSPQMFTLMTRESSILAHLSALKHCLDSTVYAPTPGVGPISSRPR